MHSHQGSNGLAPLALAGVESSDVDGVGYDAALEVMDVKFRRSGKTYRYYNVGGLVHRGLMESRSKGAYVARCVRGHYVSHELR